MSAANGMPEPGLALERTFLAWYRSALALAAFGGVAVKAGLDHRPHLLGYAIAATAVVVAGAGWVWTRSMYGQRRSEMSQEAPVGRLAAIRATTVVTFLMAVAAFSAALLPS